MAHTPGPWIEGQPGNFRVYGPAGLGRESGPIAEALPINLPLTQRDNARLIAAAPDLLEALEAAIECGMVPQSSVSDGGASRHVKQVQVADQIRAAIAKAKGD